MSRPSGPVRLRRNDCPSEPPTRRKRVTSCAWSASLLKHRHCKSARSAACQDRTPPSEPCRFRAASHQCRSSRCFGLRKQLQELGHLIQPLLAHLSRENHRARDLPQTTLGKCVPFSGEQPSMKTHFVTLHLFWPCHPPATNQSRVDRKLCACKEGQILPPRLPEGVRPSL